MCLSTVYKNTMTPETVVMKNVMQIECKDGCVLLTDLMERTVAIEGVLESANLVDGYVIVLETKKASRACRLRHARFLCLEFKFQFGELFGARSASLPCVRGGGQNLRF